MSAQLWRLRAPRAVAPSHPTRWSRRSVAVRVLAAGSMMLIAAAGPLEGYAEAVGLAAAAGLASGAGALSTVVATRRGALARARELSAVAHDLRGPLCTVTSYVDLVASGAFGAVSEEARAALRRASEVSTHAQGLVESALRPDAEATRAVDDLDTVDLDRVVRDAVTALDADARARAAVVIVEGDLPRVRGEATAIFRVVENLVQNALKYASVTTPSPRVVVRARLEAGRVVLEVQDNGPGFAAHERARVLGRGVRGEAVRGVPGAGIGLDTVRRLAVGLGGDVEVPACERGAVVRVTLRAA